LIPIISIDSLLSSCGFKIGADVSYEQLLMTISVAACEPECQAGQQVHMVLLGVWIPTAARGSKRMATKTAITGLWTQDGERSPDRQSMQARGSLASLCSTGNEERAKTKYQKRKGNIN
jgi:hypothetical protein